MMPIVPMEIRSSTVTPVIFKFFGYIYYQPQIMLYKSGTCAGFAPPKRLNAFGFLLGAKRRRQGFASADIKYVALFPAG